MLGTSPIHDNPLLAQTVESLNQIVGAQQCFIYLANKTEDVFAPLMARGKLSENQREAFFTLPLTRETDLLVNELLRSQSGPRAYDVNKENWLASSVLSSLGISRAIAMPIRSGEQVIGIFLASKGELPEDFTAAQLEIAGFAALTLALALENARLYQETQLRLEESQSLHQIALALLQKLTLEETLEIICSEAQRLTRALGSSVSLMEEGSWLRVAFRTGSSPFAAGRYPVKDSLLGMAVRRGEPVLLNNQEFFAPDFGEQSPDTPRPDAHPVSVRDAIAGRETLSLLAVPLQVKGETIGVLDVVNKRGGFSPDDVRIINLLADQASVAIDHARLYQEARRVAVLEERQRLARDLHDSVNQSLYGINLYSQAALRQLAQGNVESATDHLKHVQTSAQDGLSEMRLLIFELRPPVLENEGLVAALEQRLKSVEERTGLKTGLKVRMPTRLPPNVEDELYRITQEALNNVLKHAQATQVAIHLIVTGHTLLLRIQDDGVGFETCEGCPPGKLGLRAMMDRAEALGGKVTIESQEGQGTRITVEVHI
jgi:signal transduction histidine kinase